MTHHQQSAQPYFIGIMSGTSLDGVDAVLCALDDTPRLLGSSYVPISAAIKQEILALHEPSHNELHRAALLANQLTKLYAQAVAELLQQSQLQPHQIAAIGCHGQTVRHRPELGYTLQLQNAALLAELTQITVVADFRSRDIAAGGQGAPLVPAFHHAMFSHAQHRRVIVNIGGIANLSILQPGKPVLGFDSGPGNMLMDAWIQQHQHQAFDRDGVWAMTGELCQPLLDRMLNEPFIQQSAPKSTGRDLFNAHWLATMCSGIGAKPQDVQRTLLEFTSLTIVQAIQSHAPQSDQVFACGGGAKNAALIENLRQKLHPVKIAPSDELGVAVDLVEAYAFAWLASQTLQQQPGNLPSVTGANAARILGAIYASSIK